MNYRIEVFSVSTGEISLSTPSEMTQEDFRDFQEWIAIVMRREGRRFAVSAPRVTESR